MESIINAFYSGKLRPEELIKGEGQEYHTINKKISNCMEACKKKFSEEDFRMFEEVLDLLGDSNSLYTMETFNQGFKLGALMMMEVLEVGRKIEVISSPK